MQKDEDKNLCKLFKLFFSKSSKYKGTPNVRTLDEKCLSAVLTHKTSF